MIHIKYISRDGYELDIVRSMFAEYVNELETDLSFQRFDDELADPLKKYGNGNGVLLLAYWNGEPAGCIGLTQMEDPKHCEMKRLFVRQPYRKYGIGKALVNEFIKIARNENYQIIRLDTFKRLQSAIRLYETLDFYYIKPYYHNPYPDTVFMEKQLSHADEN